MDLNTTQVVNLVSKLDGHLPLSKIAEKTRDLNVNAGKLHAELLRAEEHEAARGVISKQMADRTEAVLSHVGKVLNGSAPVGLLATEPTRGTEQIRIELEAVRCLLAVMARLRQNAEERVVDEWAAAHAEEWKAKCRRIMLTAVQLYALEEDARQFLEKGLRGGFTSVKLVMGRHLASGELFLGGGDPLRDPLALAIADGVVTQAEIRKAQNVS